MRDCAVREQPAERRGCATRAEPGGRTSSFCSRRRVSFGEYDFAAEMNFADYVRGYGQKDRRRPMKSLDSN